MQIWKLYYYQGYYIARLVIPDILGKHMEDPNLGEDKDGLLGPKKDWYKVCSLLNKAPPNFVSAANSSKFLDIKTEVRA